MHEEVKGEKYLLINNDESVEVMEWKQYTEVTHYFAGFLLHDVTLTDNSTIVQFPLINAWGTNKNTVFVYLTDAALRSVKCVCRMRMMS